VRGQAMRAQKIAPLQGLRISFAIILLLTYFFGKSLEKVYICSEKSLEKV
jgi:hypothetical protein